LNQQGDGITAALDLNSADWQVSNALSNAASIINFACKSFSVTISKVKGNLLISVTYNIDNSSPMPLMDLSLASMIGFILT
jgi:hypothetical protein